MRKVLLTAVSIAVLTVAGCAGSGGGPSYKELVAQANAEMAKAKKMNALWRNTKKILKKANAARADADNPKARKLAKKALLQAQLAQKQAASQKGAGPRFPK